MASSANASVLAERADIHKSCKSIETLLNILNEYCEAAGAVVALQKKLSKALRETASLKTTGEIAGNAMLASANIFEVLCDIDAKFAKVADKEYDIVSTEVKKWFKKLAKEEKNHDERISSANAKIKQAGQVYEKKSKKKATDVSEEHARYINLISTLGPEISQDKYNHALNVAQRHTTTTYSVAASLSRLADSEWHRSFECVRRFSPTIGPLGQWRALCEGGWTGPIPSDLFDPDAANKQSSSPAAKEQTGLNPIEEEPQPQYRSPQPPPARLTPEPRHAESVLISPPGYSTGPPSASVSAQDLLKEQRSPSRDNSPILTRHNPLPAPAAQSSPEVSATGISPTSLEPPRAPFVDANTGSVRSLSAFPSPPTHFPIPPPRQPQPQRQHSSLSQSLQSNPSNLDAPYGNAPMSESPLSGNSDAEDSSFRTADQNFRDSAFAASGSGFLPPVPFEDRYREEASGGDERERKQQVQASRNAAESSGANGIKRPTPIKSYTSLPQDTYPRNREISARQDLRHGASSSVDLKYAYNRGAYEEDNREFGMMSTSSTSETPKGRTVDAGKYARPLERMDTGASSGSIVAAMRHRYSNNSGSMSPPPRELPRLPLSVNDMTSRYQSADVPLSPRARAGSPPFMRQQSLPMLDTSTRAAQESYQARISPGSNQQKSISAEDDRQRRQQQRNDELEEAERRTKEQELKKHERELELRARELERDRARLQNLRTDKDKDRDIDSDNYRGNSSAQAQAQSGQFGLRPRERRTSLRHQLQRPSLQLDGEDGVDTPDRDNILGASPNPRQKYGAVHLSPPSPSGANAPLSPNMPLHSPKVYSQPPTPESPYESRSRDRYPDSGGDNSNTTSTNTSSHASNCGCESCSVSKYKAGGRTSLDQQQQARQAQAADRSQNQRADSKPDKPKSWMRRLSMPVGNAFNLDSKKQSQPANGTGASSSSTTNYSLGSGVGHTPSGGSRGLFSMDGRKNSSTTALSLRPPDATSGDRAFGANEDGQLGTRPGGAALGRRSYDVSGISNRSLTNLGLAGRR